MTGRLVADGRSRRRGLRGLLAWVVAGLALAAPAGATTQEDVQAVWECLAMQDVGCAQSIVDREGMDGQSSAPLTALAAQVAFHAADYPRAFDLMQRAVDAGFPDPHDQLGLFERTLYATAGWVEVAGGRFRLRYRPGVDAVLVDPALEALERTDRFVTPLLGEVPPGNTVVEMYPDGRSFIAASSLTRDDVEATGVVAISKWTRLLVSSPRALGRGYEWQSTLSHEYIHLVVAHATGDKAPVWMQEAVAKYLDARWERGRDDFVIEPRSQAFLAAALAEDDLVPFDEMHPSIAKIKVLGPDGQVDKAASARRAALAYAQVSSLMDYCFETAGEEVLLRTLPLVARGVDPRDALAQGALSPSFAALTQAWEVWIRQQPLRRDQLEEMPTVLDGGTEDELDPVLSRRRDLANFLRLGELLAERGHHGAALLEYEKAHDDEDPTSPLLANRMAASLGALGRVDEARIRLMDSAGDYPAYPATWRSLAALAERGGERRQAVAHLERSVSLAPFHMGAQEGLLRLYEALGDEARVAEQQAVLRVLRRGGEDVERPSLHERGGEYELPRDPAVLEQRKERGRSSLVDEPAPAFEVTTLDGQEVSLAALRGKVVMLDFWATWCGPCRAVMPALSELHARWNDQGLEVLGISDEPTSTVKKWLATEAKRGVTYDHTLALEGGAVRDAYGVRSLPTLVVIDRQGVVRLVHVGAGDMAEIQTLVGQLLGVQEDEVIR